MPLPRLCHTPPLDQQPCPFPPTPHSLVERSPPPPTGGNDRRRRRSSHTSGSGRRAAAQTDDAAGRGLSPSHWTLWVVSNLVWGRGRRGNRRL